MSETVQFNRVENSSKVDTDLAELRFGSPERLAQIKGFIESQELPVVNELPNIREVFLRSVEEGSPVLLNAATGSGKTVYTALEMHKALREQGKDGLVVVLEPRIDATGMAAESMAAISESRLGEKVGFSTSEDRQFNRNTLIRVITPGIFLRWLKNGWLNKGQIDAIMLDEVHDPSLDYHLIFGLLKEAQKNGKMPPMVMTDATINIPKMMEYFNIPKHLLLKIEGRSFPLTIGYLDLDEDIERTRADKNELFEQAKEAVLDFFIKNPDGDILVFMPGRKEILETIALIEKSGVGAEVLPLYGELIPEERDKVLRKKSHKRRVVVATNVAESSLTVPGIKYVVDSCLKKVMVFNEKTGVTALEDVYISKDEANQRAGRAGRIGPGNVTRLLTKNKYEGLPQHTESEISRSNLSLTCLRLIDQQINPFDFDFYEKPPIEKLVAAREELVGLGLLNLETGSITERGKAVAELPFDPRDSLLILEAKERGVVDAAMVLAAFRRESKVFYSANKEQIEKTYGYSTKDKVKRANLVRSNLRSDYFEEHDSDLILQIKVFAVALQNGLREIARTYEAPEVKQKAWVKFNSWCKNFNLNSSALKHIAIRLVDYYKLGKVEADFSKFEQLILNATVGEGREKLDEALLIANADNLLFDRYGHNDYYQPNKPNSNLAIINSSSVARSLGNPVIIGLDIKEPQNSFNRFIGFAHPIKKETLMTVFPERITQERDTSFVLYDVINTNYNVGRFTISIGAENVPKIYLEGEAKDNDEYERLKDRFEILYQRIRILREREINYHGGLLFESKYIGLVGDVLYNYKMSKKEKNKQLNSLLQNLNYEISERERNIEKLEKDFYRFKELIKETGDLKREKFSTTHYTLYGLSDTEYEEIEKQLNNLELISTNEAKSYGSLAEVIRRTEKLKDRLQNLIMINVKLDSRSHDSFVAQFCNGSWEKGRRVLENEFFEVYDYLNAFNSKFVKLPKQKADRLSEIINNINFLHSKLGVPGIQPSYILKNLRKSIQALNGLYLELLNEQIGLDLEAPDVFKVLWHAIPRAVYNNAIVREYIDDGLIKSEEVIKNVRSWLISNIFEPKANISVRINIDDVIERVVGDTI